MHVRVNKLNKQDFQHREQEGTSTNTRTHTRTTGNQGQCDNCEQVCVCVSDRETEEVLYLHYPLVHHNLSHFILGVGGANVCLYCLNIPHWNRETSVVRLTVLFVWILQLLENLM